jgi:hypothetical protein
MWSCLILRKNSILPQLAKEWRSRYESIYENDSFSKWTGWSMKQRRMVII